MSPKPEKWLENLVVPIMKRHPEIEQVYLLGNQARGPQGQKPNYSVLFYAGYDHALPLMTSLARSETEMRPLDGIVHLYIENYGATFCGIWGGALIPNELNRSWVNGLDYQLWVETGGRARSLEERLHLPVDRRQTERRECDSRDDESDQLEPLFSVEPIPFEPSPTDRNFFERRTELDRRRDLQELIPLLDEHSA